jgi:hypothetical protein
MMHDESRIPAPLGRGVVNAPTHRLLEASQLKHENSDPEIIDCYSASELRSMLEGAAPDLQPVIKEMG